MYHVTLTLTAESEIQEFDARTITPLYSGALQVLEPDGTLRVLAPGSWLEYVSTRTDDEPPTRTRPTPAEFAAMARPTPGTPLPPYLRRG